MLTHMAHLDRNRFRGSPLSERLNSYRSFREPGNDGNSKLTLLEDGDDEAEPTGTISIAAPFTVTPPPLRLTQEQPSILRPCN